eukprot:ANDGO_01802.mRNA.1 hypothetical protein
MSNGRPPNERMSVPGLPPLPAFRFSDLKSTPSAPPPPSSPLPLSGTLEAAAPGRPKNPLTEDIGPLLPLSRSPFSRDPMPQPLAMKSPTAKSSASPFATSGGSFVEDGSRNAPATNPVAGAKGLESIAGSSRALEPIHVYFKMNRFHKVVLATNAGILLFCLISSFIVLYYVGAKRVDGDVVFENSVKVQNDLAVSGVASFSELHVNGPLFLDDASLGANQLFLQKNLTVYGGSLFSGPVDIRSGMNIASSATSTFEGPVAVEGLMSATSLIVPHQLTVGANLTVEKDASVGMLHAATLELDGSLALNGSMHISANLTVVGATNFFGGLVASGPSFLVLSNETLFQGSVRITSSNFSVRGSSTLNGSLAVKNSVTLSDSLLIGNQWATSPSLSVNASQFLFIAPKATFLVNASSVFDGRVRLSAPALFQSSISIEGSLNVSGSSFFADSVVVNGSVSASGSLAVSGDATVGGSVVVKGFASVNDDLRVGGMMKCEGPLSVGRNLSVANTAQVAQDVIILGNLIVRRNMTVEGSQDVYDQVIRNLGFGRFSGLRVDGSSILNGSVTVSGSSLFSGNVSVAGPFSSTGTASFSGPVTLRSGLFISSGSLSLLKNSKLLVSGNMSVYGNSQFSGSLTVNNTFSVASDVSVDGQLTVGRSVLVSGSAVITGTLSAESGFFVNNVSVHGYVNVSNGLTVMNDVILANGSLLVGKNLSVQGNATFVDTVFLDSRLTVRGPSTFSSAVAVLGPVVISNNSLTVNGVLSVNGSVNVERDVTLRGDFVFVGHSLLVSGVTGLNSSTSVTGNLSVAGLGRFSGGVEVTGVLSTVQLNVSGSLSVSGTVVIGGSTTISSSLFVQNSSTVGGLLTVLGSLNVTDRAVFDSQVFIKGGLFVHSNTTFYRNVSVAGSLSIFAAAYFGDLTVVTGTMIVPRLNVSSVAIFHGALTVGGDVVLDGLLQAGSGCVVSNSLQTLGPMTVNGSQTVTGSITVGNSLFANVGNFSGSLWVGGDLIAEGDTTLRRGLNVSGDVFFNGSLAVLGQVSVASTAVFNQNLTVSGAVEIRGTSLFRGDAYVSGVSNLGGRLFASPSEVSFNVSRITLSSFDQNRQFWFSSALSTSLVVDDRKFFGLQVDGNYNPQQILFRPRLVPGGMFVDANGSVGIGPGVSSAQGALHVENDFILGPSLFGSRFKISIQSLQSTADHFFIQFDTLSGTFTSSNMLSFQRGTGNFGISQSVPAAKLHVNGDVRVEKDVQFADSGLLWHVNKDVQGLAVLRQEGYFNVSGENGDAIIFRKTDPFNSIPVGGIAFSNLQNSSDVIALSIRGNGSIGINTLYPTHYLDVAGNARFRREVLLNDYLEFDYQSGSRLLWKSHPSSTSEFLVRTIENLAGLNADAVLFDKTSASNATAVPGAIIFSSTPSTGVTSYQVVIRTDTKRVGINELNPMADLDTPSCHVRNVMQHSTAIEYQQAPSLTSTLLYAQVSPTTNPPDGDGFRVRYLSQAFGVSARSLVFEKTDGTNLDPVGLIGFAMTGSDGVVHPALVIRGSGNVGIGTSSPSSSLEVVGDVTVSQNVIISGQYQLAAGTVSSTSGIQSSSLVLNAAAHSTSTVGWSVLSATWDPVFLVLSVSAGVYSFEGNGNFNLAGASASGSALSIPFTTPYALNAAPICQGGVRNYPGFLDVTAAYSSLTLRMYSTVGSLVAWSSLPSLGIQLTCVGVS